MIPYAPSSRSVPTTSFLHADSTEDSALQQSALSHLEQQGGEDSIASHPQRVARLGLSASETQSVSSSTPRRGETSAFAPRCRSISPTSNRLVGPMATVSLCSSRLSSAGLSSVTLSPGAAPAGERSTDGSAAQESGQSFARTATERAGGSTAFCADHRELRVGQSSSRKRLSTQEGAQTLVSPFERSVEDLCHALSPIAGRSAEVLGWLRVNLKHADFNAVVESCRENAAELQAQLVESLQLRDVDLVNRLIDAKLVEAGPTTLQLLTLVLEQTQESVSAKASLRCISRSAPGGLPGTLLQRLKQGPLSPQAVYLPSILQAILDSTGLDSTGAEELLENPAFCELLDTVTFEPPADWLRYQLDSAWLRFLNTALQQRPRWLVWAKERSLPQWACVTGLDPQERELQELFTWYLENQNRNPQNWADEVFTDEGGGLLACCNRLWLDFMKRERQEPESIRSLFVQFSPQAKEACWLRGRPMSAAEKYLYLEERRQKNQAVVTAASVSASVSLLKNWTLPEWKELLALPNGEPLVRSILQTMPPGHQKQLLLRANLKPQQNASSTSGSIETAAIRGATPPTQNLGHLWKQPQGIRIHPSFRKQLERCSSEQRAAVEGWMSRALASGIEGEIKTTAVKGSWNQQRVSWSHARIGDLRVGFKRASQGQLEVDWLLLEHDYERALSTKVRKELVKSCSEENEYQPWTPDREDSIQERTSMPSLGAASCSSSHSSLSSTSSSSCSSSRSSSRSGSGTLHSADPAEPIFTLCDLQPADQQDPRSLRSMAEDSGFHCLYAALLMHQDSSYCYFSPEDLSAHLHGEASSGQEALVAPGLPDSLKQKGREILEKKSHPSQRLRKLLGCVLCHIDQIGGVAERRPLVQEIAAHIIATRVAAALPADAPGRAWADFDRVLISLELGDVPPPSIQEICAIPPGLGWDLAPSNTPPPQKGKKQQRSVSTPQGSRVSQWFLQRHAEDLMATEASEGAVPPAARGPTFGGLSLLASLLGIEIGRAPHRSQVALFWQGPETVQLVQDQAGDPFQLAYRKP